MPPWPVAGGVLAAWGGGGEAGAFRGGELLVLAAVTVFTWYSLGAQHWMGGLGQLGISAITMMLGCLTMVALLPLLVLLDVARPGLDAGRPLDRLPPVPGRRSRLLLAVPVALGREQGRVTIASIYANLVPVVVVAIRMVQGQPPTAAQLAGGALIVAGVLLAQLLPARPRRAAAGGTRGMTASDALRRSGSDAIGVSPVPAANVASVPQRSPLRYPGGKTWLIPHVRVWLERIEPAPGLLVEPFAGGGIVSLTAVMERLAERCLMAELDRDVAALLACGFAPRFPSSARVFGASNRLGKPSTRCRIDVRAMRSDMAFARWC